ncbi:MAG: hypothetical protein JXA82_00300 [Sedimentisphaerales bacterium]|nr:hypothetical protein [Sedimentisphaerales bacterium]
MYKWIIILTLCGCLYAKAVQETAVYDAVLPDNPNGQQIKQIVMSVFSPGPLLGPDWYRLAGKKVNGKTYTIWFSAIGDPFSGHADQIKIHRYILQEGDHKPIEYVDGFRETALLPLFGLVENLLPRRQGKRTGLLPEKATYLGHPLIRNDRIDYDSSFNGPPAEVLKLMLRSDLLVGTSRNFRDDGKGRKSREDNYNFVPFTKENYREMIDAGINYFVVKGQQVGWICREPVFYEGYSPQIAFPEELYRPNFRGIQMFIDEPACLLAGKYPNTASLETAVQMIHNHINERMNNVAYYNLLVQNGINPGNLQLIEPAIPIWETYIGTSYYQLEANGYGIIQECRWRLRPEANSEMILMLQQLNREFDVEIPITAENLFLWFYSQMRGPARAMEAKWGMSIYGQAEPDLRLPSMKLAYDLGAEFIWMWTSDHDHHVEYTEQLRLARTLRDYTAYQPRRDLDVLRHKAGVAVVLPYGYTLPTVWQIFTWGTHIYPLDRKNEYGLTYKQVLTPAVQEIATCLTDGIAYDVIPDGSRFEPAGYQRVIWIREDGKIITIENKLDILLQHKAKLTLNKAQ